MNNSAANQDHPWDQYGHRGTCRIFVAAWTI